LNDAKITRIDPKASFLSLLGFNSPAACCELIFLLLTLVFRDAICLHRMQRLGIHFIEIAIEIAIGIDFRVFTEVIGFFICCATLAIKGCKHSYFRAKVSYCFDFDSDPDFDSDYKAQ